MSNKKTPQSTITKSRIASSKWLQLLCAILTLALDVVVLLVLFVNTTEIKYIVCPILLLVLDLVFIVKVLLSNYRFMYAVGGVLVHVACIILACGGAVLASGALGDRVVFETIALIALPAVHLLQCIAALCNAWHAIRRGKPVRRIVALVTSAILVVGIGLYVNFLHVNGFFGQGATRTERTVVYILDDSGSYYIAVDVLDGKGNTVTIPAEFNGLPVKGVDCTLFGHEEISYMVFAGSSDLEFLNTGSLAHVNENLSLEVDKTNVDEFRGEFYTLARENPEMLYVANHIKPIGLKEDEVYVIPRYDMDTLELANGQILPTWFGSVDETLNVRTDLRYAAYDCIRYSDLTDEEQLYWCFVNQKAQVFRWLRDGEGNDLSAASIGESVEVYVTFDRIYPIHFGEDNDTLYTLDPSYTGFYTDGEYIPYKLATADRAAEVIMQIPGRNGFALTWLTGPDRHYLTDLPTELQGLSGGASLNVYPEWKLNLPTIDSLTAKNDQGDEVASVIYGENVSLAAQAAPPHEDISLKYEWVLNQVLSEEKNYIITNFHPQDATTYTLRVTAYSDASSLTATAEKTIAVGFEKKELRFDWHLPENTVYEAGNKPLSAEALDPINNDEINARLSRESVRDVGEYNVTIELYGDTATKYRVAENDVSRTVVITPYPLSVNWDEDRSFEYDGTVQRPGASVQALGQDDVPLSFSGGQKNAGTGYRVTATTTNPNYTLTGGETAFEIKQRPITRIEWTAQDSFVYNAYQKIRPVNGFEGCVTGDRDMLINSVIYSGHQVNVGENYTTTVSLPEDSNYYFAEECNIQSTFKITKRTLTIQLSKKLSKVYDGTPYENFTYEVSGRQGLDRDEEIFKILSYEGDAVTAVNAREQAYTYTAVVEPFGEKSGNYEIKVADGAMTINKKRLDVKIDAKSKTYDGFEFPADEYTFTAEGLAPVDQNAISDILRLEYKGSALTSTNASTWTIDADVIPVNSERYGNYDVKVTKGKLTINKAPATVTAIVLDNGKTYDALPYTEFDFEVMGLVGDDEKWMLGDPTFGGAATNNPNATAMGHTLTVSLPSNDVTNNYVFTYEDGKAYISPKSITVTAVGGTKTYDGTSNYKNYVSIEWEGILDADLGKMGTPDYDGEATNNRNVGIHELTVTLPDLEKTGNYEIDYLEAYLVIEPRTITVTLKPNLSKTYDGEAAGTQNFSYNSYDVSGLVGGDKKADLGEPLFGGDAFGAVNAGTYELTLDLPGNPNYIIESIKPVTFTIHKRTLTVSMANVSRVYDGTVGGNFTYTVNGLQGSDSEALLGEPIFSGPATEAKNFGTYRVYLNFANTELENYTVRTSNGYVATAMLAIAKARLQYTIHSVEKEYDGVPLREFDITFEGLVDGDTVEPRWSLYDQNDRPVNAIVNAGEYSMSITFDHPNYEKPMGNPGTCTIKKKTVQITIDPVADKQYDGEAVTGFGYTAVGLLGQDQLSGAKWIIRDANGNLVSQAVNAGVYSVTVSFGAQTNYEVAAPEAVTFEITKRPVTVSAIAPDRDYDGTTGGNFEFNMLGLAAGDSKNDFDVTFGGSAMTAKDPGTYTLTVTVKDSAKARNYEFDYVSNDFVIREVETEASGYVDDEIALPPETQE